MKLESLLEQQPAYARDLAFLREQETIAKRAAAVHPIVYSGWVNTGSILSTTVTLKNNVRESFLHQCVISRSMGCDLVVAHIIPKRNYQDFQQLHLLKWKSEDIQDRQNLLLMQKQFERHFDNRWWTFIPLGKEPEQRKGGFWFKYKIKTFRPCSVSSCIQVLKASRKVLRK
jgi:hypothetical protein